MTTARLETLADSFIDGIRSVVMPGRGLHDLRAEMSRRNAPRRALVRNLYLSTSLASRSTSKRSSGRRFSN